MIPIKPSNVFWSDEQWRAIHDGGKSILVNAGAGSGKTAVLTQRIIEILKKGISLDRLIVLTFTKAAAREMKERVRKALIKYKGNDPHLREQLDYLDQAAIQTFDAFALSLVKRYHYLLGVNKSINIGDDVILSIKLKNIINDVFNSWYELKDKDFLDFVSTFALKKDDSLQECIFNICKKVDLLTDSGEFLETYFDKFYSENYINQRIDEFIELIKFDLERIQIRLNNIENIVSDEKLVKFYEDLKNSLTDLLAARTYKGFLDNINVSYPRLPGKGTNEEEKIKVTYERDKIKELVERIKKVLIYESVEEIRDELFSTKIFSKVIIEIISEVNRIFNKYKKQTNLYGFLDIAKLAIKIFEENQELKAYYKNYIYEILIDEYQDTSDIQEKLISEISNNNVYMVGDIKQSIYRFRNANPDIFKNKYDAFKNSNNEVAIDLSKNFRSRKEVLKNINDIFSKVMTIDLGGVNYDNNHALEFGNLKYEKNAPNSNYDLDVLTYSYDEDGLSASEKEAFIVGKDIKDKIDNKYQIYDKDKDCIRDCKFSDFTILVSEKSKFELYKKIFEYMQIPLVIHKDEDFIRSNEIYVIKNILRAVYSLLDYEYYKNNFKDAIYSILRSFLVEANDEEISYLFLGDIKEGLNLRFNEVYSFLIKISRMVEKSTLSEILAEIYRIFDIYLNVVKLGNVDEIENKLNFLLDKFSELDSSGYNLADAIEYLEVLIIDGYDLQTTSEVKIDDTAVNIMTIHKSKGLEFPICYFVELSSRFKISESNDRITFDQDYGFIMPVFKEGLRDTIFKSLLKNKYLIEEISERLRVFYVALTRAKEKIIIVCEEFSKVEDFYGDNIPLVERLNYNSFYAIINSLRKHLMFYRIPTLFVGTKEYEKPRSIELEVKKTKEIDLRSVNVRMKKIDKKIASSASDKLLSKEELKNMEFGTLIHEYFELINPNVDIEEQLAKLNIDDFMKEKILKFYNLEIFKDKILNVYHEYQFSYQTDNIINRGIIDLILEFKDKILIIDFKLSNLDKEEYSRQLQVYYDYLKKITKKRIDAYLYSIIKEDLRLIIQGE